jgi:hypothetical protein
MNTLFSRLASRLRSCDFLINEADDFKSDFGSPRAVGEYIESSREGPDVFGVDL